MGPIIGAIVLLICLGFVVMMVVSEWSRPESVQVHPGVAGSARPAASGASAPKKKAVQKAKKAAAAPKKKAAAKKKKK